MFGKKRAALPEKFSTPLIEEIPLCVGRDGIKSVFDHRKCIATPGVFI
jgi:hypothetical protein